MKAFSILAAVALVAAVALQLVPSLSDHHLNLRYAALGLGLLSLILLLLQPGAGKQESKNAGAIAPNAVAKNRAEAEVVSFLALMQENGRLVDFLMDDIGPYEDAQVGAAARVVHEGCRKVLTEYLRVEPISDGEEGGQIALPENYRPEDYRLLGSGNGQAGATGRLVHRGWKAGAVKLPTVIADHGLPCIAPSEVELT
ncbi:MAG: DUF2760 domain-containing protein [Verrucomicrobiota bacterium]